MNTQTITVAAYATWNGEIMYYNHLYSRWELAQDADFSEPTRYETSSIEAARDLAEEGMDVDFITIEEIESAED